MKSKVFFLPLLFFSAFLVNCQGRPDINDSDPGSKLATLTIGELSQLPNGEQAVYTKLELKISGVEPTLFEETLSFAKSMGANGDFTKSSTKLPFGTYRFLLSYHDLRGQVVFESCAAGKDSSGKDTSDEKSRMHKIDKK